MKKNVHRDLRFPFESLESKRLLAVDLLANVDFKNDPVRAPRELTQYQDQLVFRMNNGSRGVEVWATAGTPQSTRLVVDVWLGVGNSGPRDFFEFDDALYFSANDGTNGYELWISDGTQQGSHLVADIWEGVENGVPSDFTVLNDKLYFFANDGVRGRELWTTDGTREGTKIAVDVVPGATGISGERVTRVGDQMFFVGDPQAGLGQQAIWVSDGTFDGTRELITDPQAFSSSAHTTAFGHRLIVGSDNELWLSDGTLENTAKMPSASKPLGIVNGLRTMGDRLFVSHTQGIVEYNSDLEVVRTIEAPSDGLEVSNGDLYYWNATGLYVDDGNSATRLLIYNSFFDTKTVVAVPTPLGLTFASTTIRPGSFDIWVTDGTVAGLHNIDTVTDSGTDPLQGFQQIGQRLYFVATNGEPQESLWLVDLPVPAEVVGDVTGDRIVNAEDVDAIFAAARNGDSNLLFDLNGDGSISQEDGLYIATEILKSQPGDLDLNGRVDFSDFLKLSANFGNSDLGWSDGDQNGDGDVSFPDFLLLSANFGFVRAFALPFDGSDSKVV